MAKVHVTTTINDEPMEFLCEPSETMLDVDIYWATVRYEMATALGNFFPAAEPQSSA